MTCLCCGSASVSLWGSKGQYRIWSCADCHFGFVHPTPAAETLYKHYNQRNLPDRATEALIECEDRAQSEPNPARGDWFRRILSIARQQCSKDRLEILEVGAGQGQFVHFANTLGHSALGTESTREIADSASRAINGEIVYIEDDCYSRCLQGRRFDLIYLEHVLEHLPNPGWVLPELKNCMRDGSIMILCVPNHSSLLSRVLGLHWTWTCPPDHLCYYNAQSLASLLQKLQFEVVETWTGDYFFRSIYQFYSLTAVMNRVQGLLHRQFGLPLTPRNYAYRYPDRWTEVLDLLPYWVLFPAIQLSNRYFGGTELVTVARLGR